MKITIDIKIYQEDFLKLDQYVRSNKELSWQAFSFSGPGDEVEAKINIDQSEKTLEYIKYLYATFSYPGSKNKSSSQKSGTGKITAGKNPPSKNSY
jgi:hypothetical protein